MAREKGFISALVHHGVKLTPMHVVTVGLRNEKTQTNIKLAEETVGDFLKKSNDFPDVFIAENTDYAVGAFNAIKAFGLSVPHDIALAAMGDLPEARVLEIPLTVFDTPIEGMGFRAASELLKLIDERKVCSTDITVHLHGKLVVRESCPPRQQSQVVV